MMKRQTLASLITLVSGCACCVARSGAADRPLSSKPTPAPLPYAVTDTSQERCYDLSAETAYPSAGSPFYGQDAQYRKTPPDYRNNGDGTVSDLSTGLMWLQDPGAKKTYDEAAAGAARCRAGGHTDWRLPSIKELYSLMDFRGTDPNPMSRETGGQKPFIDAQTFSFQYGKEEEGDRIIDSQFATCTLYVGTTMGGNKTMFGVNFADGRIKGYPAGDTHGRGAKKYYVLYVRGNPAYGKNRFKDNRDGTVTDEATGLTWQRADSAKGMSWKEALAYAEALVLGGKSDWRLPDAKELQSIVDYSRAPDTTGTAAIDPLFGCTPITNEAGQKDFACYWTGTTHTGAGGRGETAAYVAFGRAMGYMRGRWMDVHGAGCQRSDPKEGDPADYPQGRGPQGDAIRILNHVRCVRGGAVTTQTSGPAVQTPSPSRVRGPQPGGAPQRTEGPEARGGPGAAQRPSFVRRLDRDNDGKVARAEFDGPPEHFPRLDTNGDGYLTEDEAPPFPPPGGRGRPER